jgi:hypothetical protein
MSGASRWPTLMKQATAAEYLDYTRVKFRAMVAAGIVPPGRLIEGEERWSRRELDRAADRLFQLESKSAEEAENRKFEEALKRHSAHISGAHSVQG